MGLVYLRHLRPRWKNPYAEFGLGWLSLKFFDAQSERGFAKSLSTRLATEMRKVGFVIFVLELAWIAMQDFDPKSPVYEDDIRLYHIGMVGISMNGLMGLIGLIMSTSSYFQLRNPRLRPRQFEIFLNVCAVMLLVCSPFADWTYITAAGWPDSGFNDGFCSSLLLMSDCIVTFASLMPLRWSSVWVLDICALLWYPLLHGLLLGQVDMSGYIVLVFLIIFSAIGKRAQEVQERRLFLTIASERTLRATTEFRLTQNAPQQQAQDAQSNAASLETNEVFDGQALAGESAVVGTLSRIKVLAEREQWLIPKEDISIMTSQVINSGGFGAIVEGSLSGLPVALKFSLEPVGNEVARGLASLVSELRVLRKVRHPNLVLFLGAVIDPALCEVALVLELVLGPDLRRLMKSPALPKPLLDPWLYKLSCDIVRALRYLHGHSPPIVHGDLKPGNILIERSHPLAPTAKLVDFGLSRILSGNTSKLGGSVKWMAPEIHAGNRNPTKAVDMYGVGRIMSYIITGLEPFNKLTALEIRDAIFSGPLPEVMLPQGSSAVAAGLHGIVEECVQLNPSLRPDAEAVCQSLQNLGLRLQSNEEVGVLARDLWGSSFMRSDEDDTTQDSTQLGGTSSLSPWDSAIPTLRTENWRPGKAITGKSTQADATPGDGASRTESKHGEAPGGGRGARAAGDNKAIAGKATKADATPGAGASRTTESRHGEAPGGGRGGRTAGDAKAAGPGGGGGRGRRQDAAAPPPPPPPPPPPEGPDRLRRLTSPQSVQL